MFTVIELSGMVGMSPRNIRAHQARQLLPPPVRRGRIAYYSPAHVQRLKAITALQRKGYNLASIEAILGPQPLRSVAGTASEVIEALCRLRVIERLPEGSFAVLPRATA